MFLGRVSVWSWPRVNAPRQPATAAPAASDRAEPLAKRLPWKPVPARAAPPSHRRHRLSSWLHTGTARSI